MKLKHPKQAWRDIKQDIMQIANNLQLIDFLFVSIMPILAILVFILPADVQNSLFLNRQTFSLSTFYTIWTAGYVHADFQHMQNNLIWFVFVGFSELVVFSYIGLKKRFYSALLNFAFILPILHAIIFLLGYPLFAGYLITSRGLSIIVAAVIGLSPYAVYKYLYGAEKKVSGWFLLFFSMYAALLIVIYYSANYILILFLVILLVISFIKSFQKVDLKGLIRAKYIMIRLSLLCLILVFLLHPFMLYKISVSQSGVVDILAHYIGFIYGASVGFLLFRK